MAARKLSSDSEVFSTRRLEALTDGVFAIAMTLLVLDLHIKDLGDVTSSGQLWRAIVNIDGSIISFAISFLLLGSMWAVHTRQFERIKQADRHLIMINTWRLLAVVFIPLTTSIAGSYDNLVLGRVLLPINFLILAALSYWEWSYAVSKKAFYENLTTDGRVYADARNQAIIFLAAVVVVLSAFVGDVAFVAFFAMPLTAKWFNRLNRAS